MAEAPRIARESDSIASAQAVATRLIGNIEQVVLGKHDEIALVLSALASGGHVLLEDVPGTAKTILARSIAQTIEGTEFTRIQCTPDLQPTDVTGLAIYNQKTREFEFRAGPIFANIVLVDEINRAMPRTQSALLEAMAEGQVTVDGVTRPLPAPFLVIATENPIEQEGTFPLPEAQLDRFALRSALGYPSGDEEVEIVVAQRHGHPIATLQPRVDADDVETLRAAVEDVYVDDLMLSWIVELVRATRRAEGISTGASVRGSLTLERTSRAWALMQGRDHAADEAPRVVVVCDRRPAMGIYSPTLPWLSKPRAVEEATAALVISAMAARADVASLDYGDGEPYWLPPGRKDVPALVQERQSTAAFEADDDNLAEALTFLGQLRSDLPTGAFVFVLSDFLVPPPPDAWLDAVARGWDVVPVVIQDPVWEQSFPDVASVAVPVADPRSGRTELVRLSRGEVRELRERNERRLADLLAELVSLGLEPVLLGTSEPFEIDRAFIEWAELRRVSRWAR